MFPYDRMLYGGGTILFVLTVYKVNVRKRGVDK